MRILNNEIKYNVLVVDHIIPLELEMITFNKIPYINDLSIPHINDLSKPYINDIDASMSSHLISNLTYNFKVDCR